MPSFNFLKEWVDLDLDSNTTLEDNWIVDGSLLKLSEETVKKT